MQQLPDFEAWAIFSKVAECGSFSDAARELGLTKATVSRAVTRLETRLRTTLLTRTTRKLSLTESGRAALGRAARILDDGAAMEAEILEEAAIPRGPVRLACSAAFGVRALAPLLPDFFTLYPEIDLDFHITDEPVDLIAAGFDMAIKPGAIADSSLRVTRLVSLRTSIIGAPAFFERHGRPEKPEDLARLPVIVFTQLPQPLDWRLHHPHEGERLVRVEAAYRFNNAAACIPTLTAGLALSAQPELFVRRELANGTLETVLPDWTVAAIPIHALTPPAKARPARVRVLIDFLRRRLGDEDQISGPAI
ncbi:LysR family transcriptional regulator [Caulobacter soli]|uniref:LysR family transcriptional regulator n=1 Tax=Caulobacter soli TaxID=2708539 RepID=UPI0013EC3AB2|nr:LysR family transcriptional regulator [Caulobacter soli]